MQLSTAVAGGTSAASLAAAPMAILRQAMSQGPAALFIGEFPPPLVMRSRSSSVMNNSTLEDARCMVKVNAVEPC